MANTVGRFLAKIFFIDLDYRQRLEPKDAVLSAAQSIPDVDVYAERDPTVGEWLSEHRPTIRGFLSYLLSLFPFLNWIFHYNFTWLLGDVVAGVTVGFVAIPQGMAYALLAKLPVEYGLYTSFTGFILYWAFATSKDITIGTVAVMSQLVGNIVLRVQEVDPTIPGPQIARALSVIAGSVLLFIGLVRLGWIVEVIPLVAITSFMTGAALSIASGQVPAMLGIPGINTRASTYLVIIDTLKGLPKANLNAAIGVSALAMLYIIRIICNVMSRKQPQHKKLWFFISTLRMAFVMLLYILISYLINRDVKDPAKARIKILGHVPSGFQAAGAPKMSTELLGHLAPDLPATIIVLIIEHIAISKSFGRINNYVINPSQELVAVGFTNIFGPFLGGYPATGSFSRTAIKSKAGVRTPLAGIFTAAIVLLALYVLTRMFFYIPMAALSGLIIHAVLDLISPPNMVYQFWELSPIEVIIFFAGVLLIVFTEIETGIYFTVAASAALLLYRIARAKGAFLGRVDVYRVSKTDNGAVLPEKPGRATFVPIDHRDGSNPHIDVQSPHPGVFIYRFGEGFNYLNQAYYFDNLVAYIQKESRRTQLDRFEKLGDRPWNDPGPRRGYKADLSDPRPILRAIILDFSCVNYLDVTSIQGLIDVRNQLDKYADPEVVEWHFASVTNRWTRRALAVAGFGYPSASRPENLGKWKPIFSIASIDTSSDFAAVESADEKKSGRDEEDQITRIASPDADDVAKLKSGLERRFATIQGVNRPFFHIDLAAALESALADADARH